MAKSKKPKEELVLDVVDTSEAKEVYQKLILDVFDIDEDGHLMRPEKDGEWF